VLKHDSVRQARNVGLFGGSLDKWLRVGFCRVHQSTMVSEQKVMGENEGVSINYGVQQVSVDGVG